MSSPDPNVEPDPNAEPAPLRPEWDLRGTTKLQSLTIDLGTYASTMALFSNIETEHRPLDPEQEKALAEGLAELLTEVAGSETGRRIADQCADLLGDTDPVPDAAGLAVLLRQEAESVVAPGNSPDQAHPVTRLRQAVMYAVESVLADEDEHALRLHLIHDTAARVDMLTTQNLLLPEIDDLWSVPEVRSVLSIDTADFDKSKLVDEPALAGDGEGPLRLPGLKRRVLHPLEVSALADVQLPNGWRPDTDLLLAQAYRDLVRRLEMSLRRTGSDDLAPSHRRRLVNGRVAQVILTYPTTAPPAARAKLQRLARIALRLGSDAGVDMRYDEAAAAAMYFLFRGFGGSVDAGLAAFRAQAREVIVHDTAIWRQIMEVIDVGGGTTDVALLAIDLHELPDTEIPGVEPSDTPRLEGRRYLLRPRVLGTSGDGQLGGDLITLRIFYWIKAALADALVKAAKERAKNGAAADASEASGFSPEIRAAAASDTWTELAPQVVASTSPDPVPARVRTILRRLLPTHTPPPERAEEDESLVLTTTLRPLSQEFAVLWNAAENAKKDAFAIGKSYSFGNELHNDLPDDCPFHADLKHLGEKVELSQEDFVRILCPVVEAAAGIAADLARQSLTEEYGDRVDVVALAGRTTSMPQVRDLAGQCLTEAFSGTGSALRAINWDPSRFVDAGRHAKQAAVLGAAWAHSTTEFARVHEDNRVIGADNLTVRLDNLLLTLPGSYGLASHLNEMPMPWLRAGSPIDRCDASGHAYIRSGWRPLVPSIALHRIVNSRHSISWGSWRYAQHAESADGILPPDVWFAVELDQEQTPTLLLRKGERSLLHPLYGSDLDSAPIKLRAFPELGGFFADGRLARLPKIEAAPVPGGGVRRVTVFDQATGQHPFPDDFAADGEIGVGGPPGRGERSGVVSRPLPEAPDAGESPIPDEYEFWAQAEEGHWIPLGALPTPRLNTGSPRVPIWAVLDDAGDLRLHVGYPADCAAASLDEMAANPGWVYRTAMDSESTDHRPERDPFTGDH
ncbi:hypothetical protein [Acrocarpospora catenulata]|uniref:hypothetical protein n=1 Tax=Acrocarpospora catenulata TaxID=2836182 RepID=UPI001BDA7C7D|nr:hypothetical protein [Acrocarpospora catenulata]